ncbi:MAG: DUF2213 domain-containing protein [Methylocella sp.]
MNELDTALSVASGESPSPTRFCNSDYVALRLSGTGVAYRPSVNEYVFRDPDIWLSDEMRRRVLGLPVVIEHPADNALTSRYFGERCVGSIVHSFVRNDELWGVARVLDSTACSMIAGGMFDTSPGVLLEPGASATVDIDGTPMLVEGAPMLLDHIALVYVGLGNHGVWTRTSGANGPGVEVTEITENETNPTQQEVQI